MVKSKPCLFFLLFLLFLSSLAYSALEKTTISHAKPCISTLHPEICMLMFQTFPRHTHPHGLDYAKFSLEHSLKYAQNLSNEIKHYSRMWHHVPVRAIDDCHQLAVANIDHIGSVLSKLKKFDRDDGDINASKTEYDRVMSLSSAILTNHETCYEGLKEFSSGTSGSISNRITRKILPQVSNAEQIYVVSHAFVIKALATMKQFSERSEGNVDDNSHPLTTRRNRVPLDVFVKMIHSDLQSEGILVNDTITVGLSSFDNFTCIQDAIDFAPLNLGDEDGYFVIYIREGIYNEYIKVPREKPYIMLLGEGVNRTVITGNHTVNGGWTTFSCATLSVFGDRFVAINIKVENTAGPKSGRAVAVLNGADLTTFYRCNIEGYQDTLFVHSFKQFYRECNIYGTVDFIFGNAAAVFQNCIIYARKPLPGQGNVITAQSRTNYTQNTGISIHNCSIKAAPDLEVDPNPPRTYLGRPWRAYSRVVIMESYIASLIDPAGWMEWDNPHALDTLYYGEYKNYGPGANTSRRVKWKGYHVMNASEAVHFSVNNFAMGEDWLPDTDVPFHGGLIVA